MNYLDFEKTFGKFVDYFLMQTDQISWARLMRVIDRQEKRSPDEIF